MLNTELDIAGPVFEVFDGLAAAPDRAPLFRPDTEVGTCLFQGILEGLVP